MICDIVSTKEVLNNSLNRAKKLKEKMDVTRDGEYLDNTIEVTERALELLKSRSFDELRELANAELSVTAATAKLIEQVGGKFNAAIGKNPNEHSNRQPFVIKSAKHINSRQHGDMLEIKVVNEKGKWHTFTFKQGYSYSNPSSANSNIMFAPNFGIVVNSVINAAKGIDQAVNRSDRAKAANDGIAQARKVLNEAKTTEELLRNSEKIPEAGFKYSRKSKRTDYKHGHVDHMRNVLADIHAIGGKPTSNEMYEYYDSLLANMHPHFFRDMNLFINEVEDDATGWVDTGKNNILLNVTSNTDSGMSNAEVYTHEVIHTMTHWALHSKTNKATELKARLDFLREKAYDAITWQDLMKADPKLSKKGAEARYDYIFNSKYSDDEFLAFALTNPAFMELLKDVKLKDEHKTGLFNTLVEFFKDLMNMFMGSYKFTNRNSNVYKEVVTLAAALGQINSKADTEIETNGNIFRSVGKSIDYLEGKFEEFVGEASDLLDKKGKMERLPDNASFVQKVMFYTQFLVKSIYNPDYRNQAGRFLTNFAGVGISAQSSVREIGRSILPGVHEHVTIGAEFLDLQRSNVDRARNNRVTYVGQSVIENFKKTLLEDEEVALTRILLEANGHVLFKADKNGGNGYSIESITKLLGDKGYRERAIAQVKRRIERKNKARANWIIGQAEGLGILMATGQGHSAQNSNNLNIVKGYLSNERYSVDNELLSLVEELSALVAINHEGKDNQAIVSELLKTEEAGIKNIVNLYGSFVTDAKNTLFKGDESHILEGYIKELFDDNIETTYAVLSEREHLEAQGFELISTFESNDTSGAEAIGYFVSKAYTRPERLAGAIALGNPHSRGMTLKEARYAQFAGSKKHAHVWFEADKVKLDAEAIKINKMLEEGVPVSDIPQGAVPVLDAEGNAVDYRNMMSKRDKAKFLHQNRKVSDVLAKTLGSVVYKDARAKQNENVTNFIKQQIADIYDNPNSKDHELEFTLIGPTSTDPEIRKLYNQLPTVIQQIARDRADGVIPIPNMLMDTYFGYSHLRLTDAPGIKHLPESIKRIINMFEDVFIDLVKIAKGNILLKMPVVLGVNIVSNILFAVSTGTNPVDLVMDYAKSIKDVHRFMQRHKKLEKYNVELLALKNTYNTTKFKTSAELELYTSEVKRLENAIKRLEREMSDNPVKELFDLGMYQAVIEDVNMYKSNDSNNTVEFLDRMTNKLPSVVKTPVQWLYLSKDTAWYQANQYVLQMSDLVARDVMNRKQKRIEKEQANGDRPLPYEYRKATDQLKRNLKDNPFTEAERKQFFEMMEKNRHASLLKYFVNYNLPNGRGEEYLNRIGVLMFTKYIKRIQRVISETGIKHPINTLITLMGANMMLNLEMIQDSSFFVKAGDDYGLYGITPIHTPYEILMTVFNPPLVNLVGGFD